MFAYITDDIYQFFGFSPSIQEEYSLDKQDVHPSIEITPPTIQEENFLDKKDSHPFVVITPPKCGTHLIGEALSLMLDQEYLSLGYLSLSSGEEAFQVIEKAAQAGRFVLTHQINLSLLNILAEKNYKVITILRDPRDQLISLLDFIKEGFLPWPGGVFESDKFDENVDELITGERFGQPSFTFIKGLLDALFPVVIKNNCYFTTFEKLVGSNGQGSNLLQQTELHNLAKFLNFHLTKEKAQIVCDKLYGNSWTFRHGQIGRWKEQFPPYRKELYKKIYGQELIRLGYEKDLNW